MCSIAFAPNQANAVVCARGVYRAGCIGPHGSVGVRRTVVVHHPIAVPRTVVIRRSVYPR
nr:hypothetical protein [Beijerinckia indica]